MVADAVTLTLQIIVTGKPFVEESGHITGFFVIRLSHKSSFLDSRTAHILYSQYNYTAALCPCQPSIESLHFLIFGLHQSKENAAQGIRAFLFENRLYDKRPIAEAIGRFFFQRVFLRPFTARNRIMILHNNPLSFAYSRKRKRQKNGRLLAAAPRESHPGPY